MSDPLSYIDLEPTAKAAALVVAANATGKAARILEKDFWVCWCLHRLFTATDLPALVFKGGTSLSKVYGAIDRFSEDVDITVCGSNLGFDDKIDLSNTARDRNLKELDGRLLELAQGKIRSILEHPAVDIVVDNDATIWVHYSSAAPDPGNEYFWDSVKIELGARNPITPSESHLITVDMAAALPQLNFPEVTVDVLAPERTFWEKATILHAEFYRDSDKPTAERIARHYYDLSQLADHPIGKKALQEMTMLERVASDKARLFRCKWARYDLAKPGTLRLVPPDARSAALEEDLSKMIESGMFAETQPTWSTILERLAKLEANINSTEAQ